VIILLCRAGEITARYALIDPSGGGFNPPGITAAHNTIQDCCWNMRITGGRAPASPAT